MLLVVMTVLLFPSQNIARKTKRSRPSALRELLLLAVKRMSFEGVRELLLVPLDLQWNL